MARTSAALQGLRITWSPGPDAVCPAADLFAHLPPGPAGSDVHITFAAYAPPATLAPTFFHGRIFGAVVHGQVWLWDEISTLRVAADGRSIHVAARAATAVDWHILTHVSLFIALVCALRHRHWFHMHAGALAGRTGGVLILGDSGAGKSTSALSFAQAGYALLTDDAAFLLPDGTVIGFPKSLHVTPRTLTAFPELTSRVAPHPRDPDGKHSLDPRRTPFALADEMQPTMLLFPQIGAGQTRVEPLAPTLALDRLLGASALLVVPDMPESAAHFQALAALTNATTAGLLHLGPDALEDPARIPAAALAASAPPPFAAPVANAQHS